MRECLIGLCVVFPDCAILSNILSSNHHLLNDLDKFDVAILAHLQADARLTNAELAQRVGLSPAPCWRRVRALEEAGYITGYHATLDRHKLGLGVLAFVRVDAAQNTADITERMEESIRLLPEVTTCHYISGAGTFELQVVAKDLESFSGFVRNVLLRLPNVKDVHTTFSLGEVKASSALPLPVTPTNKTLPSHKAVR